MRFMGNWLDKLTSSSAGCYGQAWSIHGLQAWSAVTQKQQ